MPATSIVPTLLNRTCDAPARAQRPTKLTMNLCLTRLQSAVHDLIRDLYLKDFEEIRENGARLYLNVETGCVSISLGDARDAAFHVSAELDARGQRRVYAPLQPQREIPDPFDFYAWSHRGEDFEANLAMDWTFATWDAAHHAFGHQR